LATLLWHSWPPKNERKEKEEGLFGSTTNFFSHTHLKINSLTKTISIFVVDNAYRCCYNNRGTLLTLLSASTGNQEQERVAALYLVIEIIVNAQLSHPDPLESMSSSEDKKCSVEYALFSENCSDT
jgi:hypothetical protein